MKIHKLTSTDGFIAFDLDDAPSSVGIVRSARKILQGGAQDLARSTTYVFASFEMQRGGASAGLNAEEDDRPAAVAAMVEEIKPMVAGGRWLPAPGKGITEADLAPLRDVDQRSRALWADFHGSPLSEHLTGVGAAAAASAASGGLEGKTVAIEGFGASGPALVRQATKWGAKVVGLTTTEGSIRSDAGLDPTAVAAAWIEHGPAMVPHIGEATDASQVFAGELDVIFAGSKTGIVDHNVAGRLTVGTLVPTAPLAFTARALAVLRRAGTAVVPDFIATAGPIFAMWPRNGDDPATIEADAVSSITTALDDVADHPDGPTLAACYRAESFLATWQDQLPFGRPMAP